MHRAVSRAAVKKLHNIGFAYKLEAKGRSANHPLEFTLRLDFSVLGNTSGALAASTSLLDNLGFSTVLNCTEIKIVIKLASFQGLQVADKTTQVGNCTNLHLHTAIAHVTHLLKLMTHSSLAGSHVFRPRC